MFRVVAEPDTDTANAERVGIRRSSDRPFAGRKRGGKYGRIVEDN
jgi:hypothetical protein